MTAFGVNSFNIDDRYAQILRSYRAIPRDVPRAVANACGRFVATSRDGNVTRHGAAPPWLN